MRKLTARDLWAGLVVAAVLIPFVGYSARGSWPLVEDPRGMAGVGLVGALLTVYVFDRHEFRGTYGTTMWTLALAAIGFGLAALLAESVWWPLVPMVAALVVMWVVGVIHDTDAVHARAVRHG